MNTKPAAARSGIKIRTAIFGVYVAASALGFAVLMAFVLQDVRSRYLEAMRRTMGDTAVFLAAFAAEGTADGNAWTKQLALLPDETKLLRVFALDPAGRVLFDSAGGQDVGKTYEWPENRGERLPTEEEGAPGTSALVGGELRVRAAVLQGDTLVGWVGVGRPVDSVAEGISNARLRLLGIALGIAGVMVAAGWWIAHKLTHSLERLTSYALAVRDGQTAAPPASRATEIAELGRAFEEMRVALEGKKYVEQYTQALTHELKAPLSVIRGAAELLHENMPPEDRARFLGHLRAESDRIQKIVDRMLQLSALEARRGLETAEPVALAPLVTEVVAALQPLWQARQLDVRTAKMDDTTVRGERFLLVQAVTNLLQNALEFTPENGGITLCLERTEGVVRIIIDDGGPGVPDYALERIFDRFYSLPRPGSGRKSTGLGLSFVREIAHLHGGEVSVANRAEGGACAVLRLPVG